ncbi:MAG TPA: family 20 glycosylhydrolase [Rhodanobacteraceae bacterium]
MRWVTCGALVVAGMLWVVGARAQARFDIVPEPQHITAGHGSFELQDGTRIEAPSDARAQWIAKFLSRKLAAQTGVAVDVVKAPEYGAIVLRIDPSIHGRGAYHLAVTANRIRITAADNHGLLWGVQTLRQLLPLQREVPPAIPAVNIEDAPAYPWRGVMLDVSRHFYPVSFIKKQIALMSYYKFNVFHWHLTDDQGWRIQIKKYPKLTSVGAWRPGAGGKPYGGFYTQKQIREVVKYAHERNVMVVPEIEMPGHTTAAIAAYPELACNDKPVKVATTWGVFRNVDCVGKAYTYRFLENVLDEVVRLFPSPYVHIGGDEVPSGVWDDCKHCAKLAKEHGFKDDEQGLHSYFVGRIQKYLTSKGKTLVGWDEILEGGVSPKAIVEVWHLPGGVWGGSNATLEKALANGNRVIIAGPYYLDTPADRMTMEDLYRTNPFHDPLFAKYPGQVLGGEAPLWSEHATPFNGAARLYPRLLAVAEQFWNPDAHNWPDFLRRARGQEAWLAQQGVPYGSANKDLVKYDLRFFPLYHRWRIRAERGFDDLRVHYTLDGKVPTAASPSFGDVLDLYKPATVTVAPFRGDVQYKAAQTFTLVHNLALGDPVTFATPPSPQYDGGPLQLTNGILGTIDFHDGRWDGWQNANMDATIKLRQPTAIHSIDVHFLQEAGSGIVLPSTVTFEVSNDGQTWTTLQTDPLVVDPNDNTAQIRSVKYTLPAAETVGYVRVVAQNYGQPVNGLQPWVFSDEVIVQ